MGKLRLWGLVLLLVAGGAWGEEETGLSLGPTDPSHFTLDIQMAVPPTTPNLFQQTTFGADVSWFPSAHLGVGLTYYYMATEYYFFDHAARLWKGPVAWGLVPETTSQNDWQFFHTRHLIAPTGLFRVNLGEWEWLVGVGAAFSFLWLSDAGKFYPEFEAVYKTYSGNFRADLGSVLRLGARYLGWGNLTLGGEALFQVPSWTELGNQVSKDAALYFRQNANIVLKAGVRF